MAREAHQTVASVTDPLPPHVGPLLARPTSWLASERAAITAALGTDPLPLAEAQRQVRTALAAAYRLPLADLECTSCPTPSVSPWRCRGRPRRS